MLYKMEAHVSAPQELSISQGNANHARMGPLSTALAASKIRLHAHNQIHGSILRVLHVFVSTALRTILGCVCQLALKTPR